MTVIRLIADDLTGALDAAVQFTAGHPGLPVLLGGGGIPSGSAAISTASRDLPPDAAARRFASAPAFVAGADIAFLKIDSLLRGHWPADLARLLAALPDHACIFAPAFPAQRRITRDGRQYALGPDGAPVPCAPVPGTALAAAGLRARHLPRGASPAAAPGEVLVCDATDQADLDRLVAAASALTCPLVWCGSAGLARALAGTPAPILAPAPAPPLIIVGSCHPVTVAQLAALPPSAAIRVGLGAAPAESGARIADHLDRMPCVATVELPAGLSPVAAMDIIAGRLAATLPLLPPPANLVVIGGETLAAVCRAVAAEALQLDGEIFPGVPAARISGGRWSGVRLISRSGAFGGVDFFSALLGSMHGTATPAD